MLIVLLIILQESKVLDQATQYREMPIKVTSFLTLHKLRIHQGILLEIEAILGHK